MNFYLCDEKSEEVFAKGTLNHVLHVAALKKLSAQVLNEFMDSDGDKFPGELVIVTHVGKPYYLPFFNGEMGKA